jgi:protein TonB
MRITLAESAAHPRRPSPWLAGSLAAHAALVSLLLLQAANAPSRPAYLPEVLPSYVEVGQEAAPPQREVGVTRPSPTIAPPPVAIPVLDLPITVAPAIPGNWRNWGQTRISADGGNSSLTPISPVAPPAGAVFDILTVERPVTPLAGNPAPRYPAALARAGVEGEVTMRFVIDTTGRVEPESIHLVRGTHLLFERAVREVLPRLRFLPAAVGGAKVRQVVEQPFRFELAQRHPKDGGP